MEFDDVFTYIGELGVYQVLVYLLLGIPSFFPGYQSIAMTFIGGTPDHWCQVSRLENVSYPAQKYIAIPGDAEAADYERCEYFDLPYNNYTDADLEAWDRAAVVNSTATRRCEAGPWVYDQSVFYSTITAEWDLVCGDNFKVSLVSTFYLLGIFFGAPLSGAVSDRVGRLPTLLGATVLHLVFGLAGAAAPSYPAFVALRFLMSVFNAAAYLTAFVIVMEIIGPKYRTLTGIVYQMFFSLGFMTLPGLAFFVRDWRLLQVVMAAPVAVTLLFAFVVPESPRWLLSRGREEDARRVLAKIAAVNGRHLPDTLKLSPAADQKDEPEQKGTFGDILRHPLLRKELFIMYLAWFTCSLVYYGLSLNTSSLVGSVYLNTFLSGLVEIPANLLCILLMYVAGRRLTLGWSFLLGGAGCLLCIPFLDNTDLGWLVTTFTLVGKGAITSAFSVVYVYTAELFPTPVRHLAVGSSSMMSRVSGLIAPFMGEPLMAVWVPLPSLIFGLFALGAGVTSFLLPETLGRPLPDTIADAEAIGRSKKKATGDEVTSGATNKAFEAEHPGYNTGEHVTRF